MAKVKPITQNTWGPVVDDLGRLRAQLSDLAKQEKRLKNRLKAFGTGAYEGELFRAVVSEYDKEKLDLEAVRAKLSPQFLAAHTEVVPCMKVTVVARIPGAG